MSIFSFVIESVGAAILPSGKLYSKTISHGSGISDPLAALCSIVSPYQLESRGKQSHVEQSSIIGLRMSFRFLRVTLTSMTEEKVRNVQTSPLTSVASMNCSLGIVIVPDTVRKRSFGYFQPLLV
jgi:hypothetical protein